MWFLIKCAFWLTLMMLLLPIVEGARSPEEAARALREAAVALTAKAHDIGGACAREPEACARAAAAARALLESPSRPPETSASHPENAGGDTLTEHDRAPAWRTPTPPPAPRRG